MKVVALIILALCLLQPLVCFAHPCESGLGSVDMVDTADGSGGHSHNQDSDSCDSTVCCAECIQLHSGITLTYAPLVSVLRVPERHQNLPQVVIPIFVPPQSFS